MFRPKKKALMEDGCPKVWVVTFDHIQQHAAHGAVCVLIIPMEPSFGAAMHWFLRLKHHKRSLRGCFRNTDRHFDRVQCTCAKALNLDENWQARLERDIIMKLQHLNFK